MKENVKQTWETPNLVVYGDMNSLTQQGITIKPKQVGSSDDFMVVGISSP